MLIPIALLVAAGCQTSPPNCPPVTAAVSAPCPASADAAPPVVADAATVDATPNDACQAGQVALLKLGCTDNRGRLIGGPNEHGVPWAQICRENLANGVDMKASCIAASTSCSEVNTSCR
jgi:hypothetical protein